MPEGRGKETQGARIQGARVAALVEEGFEQVELTGPMEILKNAGATVDIVSPRHGKVRSWHHGAWSAQFRVDVPLRAASPDEHDALLLPGSVRNPDQLRRNPDVWLFVKGFFADAKPVAAICHAPWVLIDSEVIDGRRLTSSPESADGAEERRGPVGGRRGSRGPRPHHQQESRGHSRVRPGFGH